MFSKSQSHFTPTDHTVTAANMCRLLDTAYISMHAHRQYGDELAMTLEYHKRE